MESSCFECIHGRVWRNSKSQLHRENDLPAYEGNNGSKSWYINGKCHREFGPALIWFNGDEHWYLNDIRYYPETMSSKLYIEYLKWEYRKKNGI